MHFIFALNTNVAHMNRSECRKFYFIFSKDIKLLSLSLLCNASYYLFRHINAVLFNKTFEGSQKDRIRRSTVCNDMPGSDQHGEEVHAECGAGRLRLRGQDH